MSYSTMAHALISYVESHLENFDMKEMSKGFGFSENYLRELFLKNMDMPIMQYYKKRKMIVSASELLHSDKRIIDIALQSGFSNHESYTRAFRKIFDMTPNQFRIDRPLIGRKQLDKGVFGLTHCTGKERNGDNLMTKQDEKNTILYDIRKIEQGAYGSNTMFPICVKAISEYLGDDVSYAYIMAATGAAFRLAWNRTEWDLSNIDIYHALRESNDIYQYGGKALGREFSFLGRDEGTTKEAFAAFMKSAVTKGYPVIALGIIGPPEPCIVAGFESDGDVVMGWNFFQNDPEFSSEISTMDNGYFKCHTWWENTDTQAVMCIGAMIGTPCADREVIKTAMDIMQGREENSYAKGIRAYEAWGKMLLDEKWFENAASFDELFSKLLVQNDAMTCIGDGRKWAAKYFEELSVKYGKTEKAICLDIAEHFNRVSDIARKMMFLIGDWSNTEKMLQNFKSRLNREKLAELIVSAKAQDNMAFEQMKLLYDRI